MTMRQHYKAAAITGIFHAMEARHGRSPGGEPWAEWITEMGREAGRVADALIAEDEAHTAKQQPRGAGLEGR
jgi:hypothetical protein